MLTNLGEAGSASHMRSRAMKPLTGRSPRACHGFVTGDARPDSDERKGVGIEPGLRRRNLLKTAASLGPAFTFPGLLGCRGESFSTDPSIPNVIFITADDLGWNDLGCYGNPNLGTPHIDRLAREGVRFTHAFGVTSSCAPSRASFITGEYPHTHGVTGLAHIHVLRALSPFRETLPSLLAEAGFNTALEGKWHVAPYLPASLYGYRERLSGLLAEAMVIQDSSRTLDFIRRNRDHRFYLEINYMNNHRDDRGEFHFAEGFPVDPEGVEIPPYLQLPDWPEVRLELARFYSQTRKMDAMVGDVLTLLDELELAEHTLVLFVSDNGPPFPGSKMTLYDRGIGSPLLLRWPARIPPGRVVDDLGTTLDLLPTVLEAAGLAVPEAVQGRSLLGRVTGTEEGPLREAVFSEMTHHVEYIPTRAARTRRWKYIRNFSDIAIGLDQLRDMEWVHRLCELPDQPWKRPRVPEELYDLEADPNEQRNLAASPDHREVLQSMASRLDRHMAETGDPYLGAPFTRDHDPALYEPDPSG
jgi:N-sulfoglucosamine sulfohydrolase